MSFRWNPVLLDLRLQTQVSNRKNVSAFTENEHRVLNAFLMQRH